MSKLIVIAGFGPGTAGAVADKFGSEGFAVALLARNEGRLAEAVSRLRAKGIEAAAFSADAADPLSIRNAFESVRSQMGPIGVLFWNLYGGLDAGDLLTADSSAVREVFDAPVFGLITATREALPDLQKGKGAILVSNGGLAEATPEAAKAASDSQFMGLALSSAAKRVLVGLLAERLKNDGIFVGEVLVHGTIRGTPGNVDGNIEPADIAEKHWELYQARREIHASVFPRRNRVR